MWIHLLTLGLIDGAGVGQEVSTIPTNEVGRVYVRRGKKVLLFNTPEQADQYLAAEQAANEVIEKAQKTSRRARKRLKEKVYPAADSIDLIEIEQLTVRFDVNYDLPKMFNDQDYSELVRVAEMLRQMQDEEEIELLLIA
jgi:MarR-like DNA-binding transcriptional regulator SgrR of sgrS sRNA